MSFFDNLVDDVSDSAGSAWDSIKSAGSAAISDRLVGTDKTEPQSYVTGAPGLDISNAPQTASTNSIMGFTPMQLGLGAVALVGGFLLIKKVA